MMPVRRGIPQFADIVRFCDEAGFAVYDVLEGHMRALDGALAQIDLAFVRKDSPLRSRPSTSIPTSWRTISKRPSRLRDLQRPDRHLACGRRQSVGQISASRMKTQRRSPLLTIPPR